MKITPLATVAVLAVSAFFFALGRFTAPVANLSVSQLKSTASGSSESPSGQSTAKGQTLKLDDSLPDGNGNGLIREGRSGIFTDYDFLALARTDPVAAVALAMAETSRTSRIAKLAMALEGLNAENVGEVLEHFANLPQGWESMQEYNMLMYAWGQFDAPAAVAYAQENMSGRDSRFAASTAVVAWAENDPEAVVLWLEGMEGEVSRSLTYGLIRGWASKDPYAASDYVMSLDTEDARTFNRYLDMIASELYQRDPSEAANWALSLPEGQAQNEAFERVADQWAERDPLGAAKWISQFAEADFAADAIRRVARELANTDIGQAVPWVESLPEGDTRSGALDQMVRQWSRDDITAAGEYLNTLDMTPESDAARSTYAKEVARDNPEAALPWAATISDKGKQTGTTIEIAQYWYTKDPVAVESWLVDNSSQFNDSQLEMIKNPPANMRMGGGQPQW